MPSRLSSLFKRKKKDKKTVFGEDFNKEDEETRASFGERLSKKFSRLRTRKKIKRPIFLQFKRIIAGLLFFIYAGVSIMSITEVYSILFIGTALILFEYLRETRKIKWIKAVE